MTNLPDRWEWVQLGELGDWYGGATPSKRESRFWSDGTIPWISPKDMGPDVLPGTQDKISASAIRESSVRLVPENSVAVVVRSGILVRTLPVALVPFSAALNQDMKALIPHPIIDSRWVAWGLRAFERQILQDARKSGTTVASLESSRFMNFKLPVPPLGEQQRIAALVEDQVARIERCEYSMHTVADRSRKLLEEIRSRLVRIADAELIPLGQVLAEPLVNGRSVPTRDDGFPVLRLTALRSGMVDLAERKGGDWTAEDAASFLVRRGDFFVARGNGSLDLVGRGALVLGEPDPVAFPDTFIRVVVDQDKMIPGFLRIVWDARDIRRQVEASARTTAGIYKINQGTLMSIMVPCPPLPEQARIVADFTSAAEVIRRQAGVAGSIIGRMRELRASVLKAACSGGI